jgi:hypothetical protein
MNGSYAERHLEYHSAMQSSLKESRSVLEDHDQNLSPLCWQDLWVTSPMSRAGRLAV